MVWRFDRADVTWDDGRKKDEDDEDGDEDEETAERDRLSGRREESRTTRRLRSGDVDVET